MNFLFNLIIFAAGLAVGSFINVISLRYRPEEKLLSGKTIGGRSHCPFCRKELKWFELIPLFSFLRQKGKCRNCGRLLFWQYPLVEILSGLIFLLVPLKILNFQTILNYQLLIAVIWILIFEILLLISIIDFRQYIIPDQLNLFLAILGLLLFILNKPASSASFLGYYNSIFNPFPNIWLNHIFAAIIAMAFFGAIIILTKGKGMGWGDFKLAGALGLIFGWGDILIVVALAFIIGSLVSVFLMLKKEKTMKDVVPFGPFLIVGATAVFFFGFQLIDLYFKLFLG